MRMNDTIAAQAAEHLTTADSVLAPIVAKFGICPIRPNKDYYQALVDAIISQQLSVHAAHAIEQRFRDLFGGHFPTAEEILQTDVETLRGIGFSRAKGRYVLDLAAHISAGTVQFSHLDRLSNNAVIAELTAVKGVGVWTAQIFLMFCMGRSDILPFGDLGIKKGMQQLYKLEILPSEQVMQQLAETNGWHPYESAATWYIWQSLDNAPKIN